MVKKLSLSLLIFFCLIGNVSATTRALQFDILLIPVIDYRSQAIASGYTVYFYEAGTTTPKNVWTEREKSNPYTSVTLGGAGTAPVYGDGVYKLIVKDLDATTVYTWDNMKVQANTTTISTKADTYTATSDDDVIYVNTAGGAKTINLEAVATFSHPLLIKNISTNNVVIDPDGSEQIDGAATYTITAANAALFLFPDTSAGTWRKALDVVGEAATLTGLTSTIAELNILDGVTADKDEINILDGVTSSTAEINILDGVTADKDEINIIDGVTKTTAQINDLVTLSDNQTISGEKTHTAPIKFTLSDATCIEMTADNTSLLLEGDSSGENKIQIHGKTHATKADRIEISTNNAVNFQLDGSGVIKSEGTTTGPDATLSLDSGVSLQVVDSSNPTVGIANAHGASRKSVDIWYDTGSDIGKIQAVNYGGGPSYNYFVINPLGGLVGIGKTPGNALDVNGGIAGTALDCNGNADVSGTLNIGATTTRKVMPAGSFVTDGSGYPVVSSTSFDVDNFVGAAWETVGPTDSGATNIWTGLDSVPTDADWIVVKIRQSVTGTPGLGLSTYSELFAIENGGTEATTETTLISKILDTSQVAAAAVSVEYATTAVIPVDGSEIFKLYYYTVNISASTCHMWVTGWGFNP
jgi:hypothetical protein